QYFALQQLFVGNVAADGRSADDDSPRVLDRRNHQRHIDPAAILANAIGLEVVNVIATLHSVQMLVHLVNALWGTEHRDRFSDDFFSRVAVNPPRAGV